jgi:hypothetical protein
MQGECHCCRRVGDWPVFPHTVPDEARGWRQEQESLCASCYEQIGVPFPDGPGDELRRRHEEVIGKFREYLRRTSPKPKVYNANVRFFVYDVGYRHCVLCSADGREQAPAPFIWQECDKVARPSVKWRSSWSRFSLVL